MFNFKDVSETFRREIELSLAANRLSHALILEGKSAEARLSTAREIAKALVCQGENQPCESCGCCLKAEKGIHPDIHIIKKDEKSTMIKVDAIRDIRQKALVLPNESSKSVFIISEAQLMNPQAQNALLKILEEPGSHVCFILTCPSKSSLLDTVISRATAYTLGEENEKCDDSAAFKAKEKANELLTSYIGESELLFIKNTASLQKDRNLFSDTVCEMQTIVRDAIISQNGKTDFLSDYGETAKKLGGILTLKKTMELFEFLRDIYDALSRSANINLTLTRLSSGLYDIKSR